MNNPYILKSLSATAFIISALFTIFLMVSGVNGILATVLTVGVALILEYSKVMFFTKAIQGGGFLPFPVRVALFVLSGFLFATSIIASLSFLNNQNNETRNKTIKNTVEYKDAETLKQQKHQLIEQKRKEIDMMAKQSQELPKNYYTVKQQIQDKINSKSKEVEALVNDLASQTGVGVNTEVLDQKGYTAFIKVAAGWYNSTSPGKDNPVNVETVETIFFGSISVVFELVAGLLYFLSTVPAIPVVTFKPLENTDFQSNLQGSRFETTYKPKIDNTIGFKLNHDEVDQQDLKIYLDYMHKNQRDGISPGYMKISKETSLSVESCRKIKGYLERLNVIKTDGAKTLILKSGWSP